MAEPQLLQGSPGNVMGAGTQRHWLAAYTKARHENAVARQLESKAVAFLLPTYLGVLPRRLVLVIRDISEAAITRERMQEREVMAAIGALLAGAAHLAKNAIFGLSATLDAFEARIERDTPRTITSTT